MWQNRVRAWTSRSNLHSDDIRKWTLASSCLLWQNALFVRYPSDAPFDRLDLKSSTIHAFIMAEQLRRFLEYYSCPRESALYGKTRSGSEMRQERLTPTSEPATQQASVSWFLLDNLYRLPARLLWQSKSVIEFKTSHCFSILKERPPFICYSHINRNYLLTSTNLAYYCLCLINPSAFSKTSSIAIS